MDDIAGDLPKLRTMLSPSAQARWDAAAKNKDEFRSLLTDWIRQSFERGMMHRDAGKSFLAINEKELQRFFESEISETDRKRLMALPKEDMMSQLRREYFRSKGYWKDPSGKPIGFGGRGPFGPMHDDGRGSMYRRQPDDGRPPSEGPGGERRPPNGEPPPPPPPRPGATDARGGPPRSDRDKRFGPGGPFNSDGKPTFESGPAPGPDGPSRRDRRPDPDSKPFVPEA